MRSKLSFNQKSPLARAAAWSSDPNNPPLFIDLPVKDGKQRPFIAAKWMANSLMVMLQEYAPNLKKMKAIDMSVGLQDGLLQTNRDMDEALTDAGITHHFETFEGDHNGQVGINFETKVLPFFSEPARIYGAREKLAQIGYAVAGFMRHADRGAGRTDRNPGRCEASRSRFRCIGSQLPYRWFCVPSRPACASARKFLAAWIAMSRPPNSTIVSEVSRFRALLKSRSLSKPCRTSARIKSPIASGSTPRRRSSFSASDVPVPLK